MLESLVFECGVKLFGYGFRNCFGNCIFGNCIRSFFFCFGNVLRFVNGRSVGNFGLGSFGLRGVGGLVLGLVLSEEESENGNSENYASDNGELVKESFLGRGFVAFIVRTAVAAGNNTGHTFFAVVEKCDKYDNYESCCESDAAENV